MIQFKYSKTRKGKDKMEMKMKDIKTIYFDMDGTIADLYAVDGWLPKLQSCDASPYAEAAPLVRLCALARMLNRLQRKGMKIGIVSWLAKNGTNEYNEKVTNAKMEWITKHLKSVRFDEIHIVKYGTPKATVVNDCNGILFDDEEKNRKEWTGIAYDVNDIIDTLKTIG